MLPKRVRLREREGRHVKFVERIGQICYNARFAAEQGRRAVFFTERAVLRVVGGGLELVEVAPGIDVERDVLGRMGFRPRVSPDLRRMCH